MLDTPAGPAQTAPPRGRGSPGPDRPGEPLPSGRALIGALRRRLWPFLACALVIPALAGLALARITPRYTATGSLIYEPDATSPRELKSILRPGRVTASVMASQARVLGGLRLIEPLSQRLGLLQDPEFNPALRRPGAVARTAAWLSAWFRSPAPARPVGPLPEPDQALLAVQHAVAVRAAGTSRVLLVSFTAEDPTLAAAAVNMLMDIYIRSQLAAKYRAVRKARSWLQDRADALRREVRAADDRMAAYRAREGLVHGVQAGLDTEQISHLMQSLAEARAALAAAQGRFDAARGNGSPAAAAAVAPSVVALRRQRDATAARLQSVLTRLGPRHPVVIALRRQLAQLDDDVAAETARVVGATGAAVASAHQRVAAVLADLAAARAEVERNGRAEIALDAMARDAAASRSLLTSVLKRLQALQQQAAVEQPDAHEVSFALPPAVPSFPPTRPMLAAAAGFGVLFGLFVVYLLELGDSTLPGGEAVRAALRLPCFALIPEVRRRTLGRLRVEDYAAVKPLSAFAEQVRGLRAGLWLGARRPRAVAVTAARPAEGKTTVAVALGRSAALAGERVVLLDCDLRHPSLAALFGAEGRAGLADCLRGEASLEQVLGKDPLTPMAYVGAGSAGPDGFGLFLSEAMVRVMQALRNEYDLVLLDAPPALAMSDTRVIAQIADATLLCVRWRVTPRDVAAAAIELLEESQAAVVGVALTRVDRRAHARSGHADSSMVDPRVNRYVTE
ncbi:MAG: polysaccharide biosynthesis tyrosine autokinase [Rhodospirillales bacterium]|nr:polysaccharide biosynthesis tyrosine autokinase [Rhodospirillales bacterium]